jgi:hypothetical protein
VELQSAGMKMSGRGVHRPGIGLANSASCGRTSQRRRGEFILPETTHRHTFAGSKGPYTPGIASRRRLTRWLDDGMQ